MYFEFKALLLFKLIVPSLTYYSRDLCEGKVFLNKYYEEQILFNGFHKAINLVMHENYSSNNFLLNNVIVNSPSNSLFFSHTVRKGSFLDFNIKVCQLTKMKCKDINKVVGGRAIAYDRKNNLIYLGGRRGIYTYNFTTRSAQYFAEKDKSIWNLFVQKHLYYIDDNKNRLHVYENKKFKPVPEVANLEIENFFVSKSFTMYYSNRTALFRAHRPVRPAKVIDNTLHIKQITQDYATDYVFFAANEGIYHVNDIDKGKVEKTGDINQVFGMTFKSSDIEFEPGRLIFSYKNAIMTLTLGKYGDQCLEIKSKNSLFYMPEKKRKPS